MNRCTMLWTVAALAAFAPHSLAAQGPRRPITPDDLVALKAVGDPHLSPDGALVAFTVSTASLDDNRNISRIWVVPVKGGEPKAITAGPGTDFAPRWAPDGKSLTFISTREQGAQVWRVGLDGAGATRLTSLESGVNDFAWSRDGASLYLASDVKWPAGQQELDRRNGTHPTGARIWTETFYRHWNEWRVGSRAHVFQVAAAGGPATDLTPFDRDTPPLALGGADLAPAPDGKSIALVWNPDPMVATSTNNDIFLVTGRGDPKPLTVNPANDHSPTFSPDGKWMAYLAMSTPGFEADRTQLMLLELATGARRSLTAGWDVSVAAITWMPDGHALLAEVEERGGHSIYSVDAGSGQHTLVAGALGVSGAPMVTPDGRDLVYLHQDATTPPELYVRPLDGRKLSPRALTAINGPLLAQLDLKPVEGFAVKGARGDSVFGWLLRPPAFDPSKKYPLLYLVHGGPQSAWLDSWIVRWNYAVFASRGYVVAALNFHGSTGYGQEFTNSISRNWGGAPYEDLMAGLDHLAALPFVDSTRMGAAGASYGGYMIYWMAGHTDRFKTLVSHDGVFNPAGMFGTTEELWFPIWEFGGTPYDPDARTTMERWSPLNYVNRWKTPMLVVHSQQDFRVDVSEGQQAFTALRMRGIPAKFLYFPDEGHWILRPRNRLVWWGTVLDWLGSSLHPER